MLAHCSNTTFEGLNDTKEMKQTDYFESGLNLSSSEYEINSVVVGTAVGFDWGPVAIIL